MIHDGRDLSCSNGRVICGQEESTVSNGSNSSNNREAAEDSDRQDVRDTNASGVVPEEGKENSSSSLDAELESNQTNNNSPMASGKGAVMRSSAPPASVTTTSV